MEIEWTLYQVGLIYVLVWPDFARPWSTLAVARGSQMCERMGARPWWHLAFVCPGGCLHTVVLLIAKIINHEVSEIDDGSIVNVHTNRDVT